MQDYKGLRHPVEAFGPKFPTLSGYLRYRLRCSFLHSGEADVCAPNLHFSLVIHKHSIEEPADANGLITKLRESNKTKLLKIEVVHLCLVLSKAGKVYKERIEKMGDKEKKRLRASKLQIMDLKKCFDAPNQLD